MSDSRESPQTCDSQFLAPRNAIRKNGVQFGNPETIRENQRIRANLRIDSRESGHLSSGETLRAQRLKKFNLACKVQFHSWIFQSRLKMSILTFRVPPTKMGFAGWPAWNFNLAWEFRSWMAILNFSILGKRESSRGLRPGPWGLEPRHSKNSLWNKHRNSLVRFSSFFEVTLATPPPTWQRSQNPPRQKSLRETPPETLPETLFWLLELGRVLTPLPGRGALKATLQPEIVAKLVLKTFCHVTEMRLSK